MIRTLLPMAADGVGPSQTCLNLVCGGSRAGAPIDLMVNRFRGTGKPPEIRALLPGPLGYLPYRYVSRSASIVLENWYLRRIGDGDIAWLWPAVSLRTHEIMARRDIPIVLEGINTRMKGARKILDGAYDAFGTPPRHGITDARIAEEEAKLALASTIFAPNPMVEAALEGSPLEGIFLSTSYGVHSAGPKPERASSGDKTLVFMFCGYVCIRKGAHYLLDLWSQMPKGARLRLVGAIEPAVAERYADLLASDRVEAVGFKSDVASYYRTSDVFVFPSLEEGDPLVTYEAAWHGLPIVASAAGAGRIGMENDCALIIDPVQREAFLDTLMRVFGDADLRDDLGRKAQAATPHYDWNRIGARRMAQLADFFPGRL